MSLNFRAKYSFDLEEFDQVTPGAKDLISRLLRKSPIQRISAQKCLEHEWLAEKSMKKKTTRIKVMVIDRIFLMLTLTFLDWKLEKVSCKKENTKCWKSIESDKCPQSSCEREVIIRMLKQQEWSSTFPFLSFDQNFEDNISSQPDSELSDSCVQSTVQQETINDSLTSDFGNLRIMK